jgi:hypothetical protein
MREWARACPDRRRRTFLRHAFARHPKKRACILILEFGPDISFAFPTPLLRRHLPEAATLNPGLERAILQRMQGEAGRQMSNVGGWHSQGELLGWRHVVGCDRFRGAAGLVAGRVAGAKRAAQGDIRRACLGQCESRR